MEPRVLILHQLAVMVCRYCYCLLLWMDSGCDGVPLLLLPLLFIIVNMGFNMSKLKLNALGLLPTHASDWASSLPPAQGKLPHCQEIAVKKLSPKSEQGDREFGNEVLLMAKIQHRNLVKHHGFSLKNKDRLFIYEYLPNRSLDFYLFGEFLIFITTFQCLIIPKFNQKTPLIPKFNQKTPLIFE